MVLGPIQPLTEMSTSGASWRGKGGRCLGLTTFPPSCALRTCPGLYRDCFTFTFTFASIGEALYYPNQLPKQWNKSALKI
jgi:hypothetical protein